MTISGDKKNKFSKFCTSSYKVQQAIPCHFHRVGLVLLTISILFTPLLGQQISSKLRINKPTKETQTSSSNFDGPSDTPGHENVDTTNPDSNVDLNSDPLPESESIQHPPEIQGVVRLDDHSIVLRWDLDYRAQPYLQFFKIQYRSTKPQSQWKTEKRDILPTTRAHQLNSFNPGNYFFVVSAIYNNDDSSRSNKYKYTLRAKSKIIPRDLPEQKAPEITYTNASSDYFRFGWTYKIKEKDMEDFGYLVYYRSAHQVTDFSIYNTLEESVEIAQVEPETPYEAKVLAYNNYGVSDFSETIRIKTLPNEQVTTTPRPVISSTTTIPLISTDIENQSTTRPISSSTTKKPAHELHITTTYAPELSTSSSNVNISEIINNNVVNNNKTDNTLGRTTNTKSVVVSKKLDETNPFLTTLSSTIDAIIWGQDEKYIAVRWSLILLLTLLFVFLIVICWTSCHRRKGSHKESTPSNSTNESMEFDLEINCYFKNSFPGVEKDEYPAAPAYPSHHGFVNNHPHINEFS